MFNKLGSLKIIALEISILSFKALELNVGQYTQKNLHQIILLVFQAQTSKRRSPEDKFKADSPDVYCNRSHIECYNFCQKCKDYFATIRAME